MRVVVDTSVLVSAAIRDRLPERALFWCVARPGLEWLVTPEILDEYVEVSSDSSSASTRPPSHGGRS